MGSHASGRTDASAFVVRTATAPAASLRKTEHQPVRTVGHLLRAQPQARDRSGNKEIRKYRVHWAAEPRRKINPFLGTHLMSVFNCGLIAGSPREV